MKSAESAMFKEPAAPYRLPFCARRCNRGIASSRREGTVTQSLTDLARCVPASGARANSLAVGGCNEASNCPDLIAERTRLVVIKMNPMSSHALRDEREG